MTLDEAIKHAEEVAELCARIYKEQGDVIASYVIASYSCYEYAEKYRQLADWLKELKALRRNVKRMFDDCDTCKYAGVKPDEYPCVECSHHYANQYEYDDTREVNVDDE